MNQSEVESKMKSGKQAKVDNNKAKTVGFQAETKQLLQLLSHSLYQHKDIFLRELISNASDAIDKLRYLSIKDQGLLDGDAEFKISIDVDADAGTLTISDNGIGLSEDDAIEHLGTIAKSGTKAFLGEMGDAKDTSALIGQFGVGFYSAFMVANKVSVYSRKAGLPEDQAVLWESEGEGEFSISQRTQAERGTKVVLHLRDEEKEFQEPHRLRQIVRSYSDHIGVPIMMLEVAVTKSEDDEGGDEKAPEYEQVNKAAALWTLSKSDISDEDYQEFYKHVSQDFEDALEWTHNRVEGKLEYTNLLYIPTRPPFDLYTREHTKGVKLYVQRVFITDESDQLMPGYLRFIKGVVDTNDLPLNVSRETLQHSKVIESIKNGCTKRILDTLEYMAENEAEKYATFWKAFGPVLKEGVGEDFANKDRIARLLRFSSTHTDTEDQSTSLADYVSRMKDDQKKIYFVSADGFAAAKNSPHLEIFRQKGIEVILFHERVDEWLTAHLTEFEGKTMQSIAKGDFDLSELDGEVSEKDIEAKKSEEEKAQESYKDVLARMKVKLGETIKEVRLTHRLTGSPSCLVADENELSGNLQRMLKQAGQDVPEMPPILELNPEHQLVKRLQTEPSDDVFNDLCSVLHGQALLAEGAGLTNGSEFVESLNRLLSQQD